jgi:AhpD family alkylhydroperoxidase
MTDDVQVANRRLDASGNEALIGMARMGADAFGYTADQRIDRGLAELLRLRVSQLNNCTYCLNLHYEAAREAGIPRVKIDTLTAWWETELHSEAEQAALRYTEALTRAADTDRDAAFQRFHDALAEHFSPEEMLEIVAVVVNTNVWTRIKLAEGAMPGPGRLNSFRSIGFSGAVRDGAARLRFRPRVGPPRLLRGEMTAFLRCAGLCSLAAEPTSSSGWRTTPPRLVRSGPGGHRLVEDRVCLAVTSPGHELAAARDAARLRRSGPTPGSGQRPFRDRYAAASTSSESERFRRALKTGKSRAAARSEVVRGRLPDR